MVILLNGWILPIGGVASGRVCICSLHIRLVLDTFTLLSKHQYPYTHPHQLNIINILNLQEMYPLTLTISSFSQSTNTQIVQICFLTRYVFLRDTILHFLTDLVFSQNQVKLYSIARGCTSKPLSMIT